MTAKALLFAAAFGLAAPAFAASHMEKKDAAAAPAHHDAAHADHKMDTTKMSKKDMAAHDKMMRDAMKKDATAAEKEAMPK